jgi:hypothetical protein
MGEKYLNAIEKKMKASGTAASKITKPKPIKKKKKVKTSVNLPLIRIPNKK